MKTLALMILPVIAACGRWGFEQVDPPLDTPELDRLACGAPVRFSVGAKTLRLATAATPRGYNVFTIDDAGDVRGFTYEFDVDKLLPLAGDVPVMSNATGELGSVALGDQVLVAVPYGRPDPIGTQLIPFTAQLAMRGDPVKQVGWFGSTGALAPVSPDKLVFLGQLGNGQVDAKLVSPLGVDLGAAHTVIDGSDGPGQPTILPIADGLLVAWVANTPTPNEVRAELLDAQLGIKQAPTLFSTMSQFDAEVPRVAYMAAADTYLFAWVQKTGAGGDEVWVSLRDSSLGDRKTFLVGNGYAPAIVAGDHDFLVVWEDGPELDAVRITADGKSTALSIFGDGGKFTAWDLVVRKGQPAVVWSEIGGGVNLRLDPLCN